MDLSIFSRPTNITWWQTGRAPQLSFTPMWATTVPPPTSILRPTLINFLGTELFASQTAAGSLLITGLLVLKVRICGKLCVEMSHTLCKQQKRKIMCPYLISRSLVEKVSALEAASCVHNMCRCQLHISTSLPTWTHAMGWQLGIWYSLSSMSFVHVFLSVVLQAVFCSQN